MDDIEKIEAWMRGRAPQRHWEEENKFLLEENAKLRHQLMAVRFENSGLYRKIEMLKMEGNYGTDRTGLCGLDAERHPDGITGPGGAGEMYCGAGSVRDDDVCGEGS